MGKDKPDKTQPTTKGYLDKAETQGRRRIEKREPKARSLEEKGSLGERGKETKGKMKEKIRTFIDEGVLTPAQTAAATPVETGSLEAINQQAEQAEGVAEGEVDNVVGNVGETKLDKKIENFRAKSTSLSPDRSMAAQLGRLREEGKIPGSYKEHHPDNASQETVITNPGSENFKPPSSQEKVKGPSNEDETIKSEISGLVSMIKPLRDLYRKWESNPKINDIRKNGLKARIDELQNEINRRNSRLVTLTKKRVKTAESPTVKPPVVERVSPIRTETPPPEVEKVGDFIERAKGKETFYKSGQTIKIPGSKGNWIDWEVVQEWPESNTVSVVREDKSKPGAFKTTIIKVDQLNQWQEQAGKGEKPERSLKSLLGGIENETTELSPEEQLAELGKAKGSMERKLKSEKGGKARAWTQDVINQISRHQEKVRKELEQVSEPVSLETITPPVSEEVLPTGPETPPATGAMTPSTDKEKKLPEQIVEEKSAELDDIERQINGLNATISADIVDIRRLRKKKKEWEESKLKIPNEQKEGLESTIQIQQEKINRKKENVKSLERRKNAILRKKGISERQTRPPRRERPGKPTSLEAEKAKLKAQLDVLREEIRKAEKGGKEEDVLKLEAQLRDLEEKFRKAETQAAGPEEVGVVSPTEKPAGIEEPGEKVASETPLAELEPVISTGETPTTTAGPEAVAEKPNIVIVLSQKIINEIASGETKLNPEGQLRALQDEKERLAGHVLKHNVTEEEISGLIVQIDNLIKKLQENLPPTEESKKKIPKKRKEKPFKTTTSQEELDALEEHKTFLREEGGGEEILETAPVAQPSEGKRVQRGSILAKAFRGEYISKEDYKEASKLEGILLGTAKASDFVSNVFGVRLLSRLPDRVVKEICSRKEAKKIRGIFSEEKKLQGQLEKAKSEEEKEKIKTKLEQLGVGEQLERHERVAKRMESIKQKIDESKYLSPEKKAELKKRLESVQDNWSKDNQELETSMTRDVNAVLKDYIGERTSMTELSKDTYSFAATATGAYAYRALGSLFFGTAERYKKIKKEKIAGEQVNFVREVICQGVAETAREMFGQGKLKEVRGLQKKIGVFSAWGKAVVPAAIALMGYSEFAEKGGGAFSKALQHAQERMGDIGQAWDKVGQQGGLAKVPEVTKALSETINLDETFHRLTSVFRLFKHQAASEVKPEGGVQPKGGWSQESLQGGKGAGAPGWSQESLHGVKPTGAAGFHGAPAETTHVPGSVEPDTSHMVPAAVHAGVEASPADIATKFSTEHASLTHAGFHTDVTADGKVNLSLDLHGQKLEQVFDRMAIDRMDLGKEITNLEGARILNVAANLRALSEGHNVAGISWDEFHKFVEIKGGHLTITDSAGFQNHILDHLTQHTNTVITPDNVADSGAVAYLDNIAKHTWTDMLSQKGITANNIHFDQGMIDHAEGHLFVGGTLHNSGIGELASNINFQNENSGTFELMGQMVNVNNGQVTAIGNVPLEHPFALGNAAGGHRLLEEALKIETQHHLAPKGLDAGGGGGGVTEAAHKTAETPSVSTTEGLKATGFRMEETINEMGVKSFGELEKHVSNLLVIGKHGHNTLGLTVDELRSDEGPHLLQDALKSDGVNPREALYLHKHFMDTLQNTTGWDKTETLAHFVKVHSDDPSLQKGLDVFKSHTASAISTEAEHPVGSTVDVKPGISTASTTETPQTPVSHPAPEELGKAHPATHDVKPVVGTVAHETGQVETFSTPDGKYSASFEYGTKGDIVGFRTEGVTSGIPHSLKDDYARDIMNAYQSGTLKGDPQLAIDKIAFEARQLDAQQQVLHSLEAAGKGHSVQADYLRNHIADEIQKTEARYGDVFKDDLLKASAAGSAVHEAATTPGHAVEMGLSAKPEDISAAEEVIRDSYKLYNFKVADIDNLNEKELTDFTKFLGNAMDEITKRPPEGADKDSLDGVLRGIESIKEIVDKKLGQ